MLSVLVLFLVIDVFRGAPFLAFFWLGVLGSISLGLVILLYSRNRQMAKMLRDDPKAEFSRSQNERQQLSAGKDPEFAIPESVTVPTTRKLHVPIDRG